MKKLIMQFGVCCMLAALGVVGEYEPGLIPSLLFFGGASLVIFGYVKNPRNDER